MARQTIVWTALPNGRITKGPMAGRWRVSLVASPRLVPRNAAEQQLGSFDALLRWPETASGLRFGLTLNGSDMALEPLQLPEKETWQRLFNDSTPVAGFQFTDMSTVNLLSFPVRNVLGFVRQHYGELAATAGAVHPVLLPWRKGSPLDSLLTDLGTRIDGSDRINILQPGFGRFHPSYVPGKDVVSRSSVDRATEKAVFAKDGCIAGPQVPIDAEPGQLKGTFRLRAMPPDWENPDHVFTGGAEGIRRKAVMENFRTADEYAFYQADRFYRRSTPTTADLRKRHPDFANPAAELKTPEFDFHQMIASYGDYPGLLRLLGLVIDCALPDGTVLDSATDAAPLTGRLLPLIKGLDAALQHSCLQTAWEARARRFVPRPRSASHRSGLLALQNAHDRHDQGKDSPFDVYQVDPDGSALKTVDYLLTAQNLLGKSFKQGNDGEVTYTTGDAQPVAALRSVGLGVSQHGRAGVVAIDARAAALKNDAIEQSVAAAAKVVLYAEDLLRGYRVDVQSASTGRWLSLCERVGQYTVLADGEPLKLPDDEGYVKSASTTSNGHDDDHYLHESVFRWAGWSLVAPRPGRSLLAGNDAGLQTETAATPGEDVGIEATAKNGNGIDVRFTARKGTLPRLRFGEQYRFRARLTDLAGNSLDKDDRSLSDLEQASEAVTFARFEPVGPPALVQQGRLSEGESLERMVIRSNFDSPANRYTQGAGVKAFYNPPPGGTAARDFAYTAINLRHVVPPKAAQTLCEQHGRFDGAVGGNSDAKAIKRAYAVAALESGSLLDALPGTQIELITPTRAAAIATVTGPGAQMPPPDQADPTSDRFAAGQYVLHREDLVPIPYLPDPVSGGLALHGVPGLWRLLDGQAITALAPGVQGVVIDQGVRAARLPIIDRALADPDAPNAKFRWVLLIDFDTDPQPGDSAWPEDRQSLCIALHDQPDEVTTPPCGPTHTPAEPPKWDSGRRTLHLFLPQGRISRLQYASFVHDQYLNHLGLQQWVGAATAVGELQAASLMGAHWMVTPFRRLTLVHATQQPVCVPVLMPTFPARPQGATFVDLIGKQDNIALHGPSTGKFEVLAQWSEWVDDPAHDDVAHPGPRRIACEGALGEIRLADNHVNTFPIERAVLEQRSYEAGAGQTRPDQIDQRANAAGNRHEFGDTRFRRVLYRLQAATRFREYLPFNLYARADLVTREGMPLQQSRLRVLPDAGLDIDKDPGAPMLPMSADAETPLGLVVPASAPPDAPRVVYTLPTFRWNRPAPNAQGEHTSTREGNALRVYLDRPWFSSGDGELLAVVVAPLQRGVFATPFDHIQDQQSDRVTQWGFDPLWESTLPDSSAEPSDFPLRVAEETVALPFDGGNVTAVAHRVHWSPERLLWYCDIEISTGRSYMPFVRLALARYQPNAIGSARLSAIVLADFAQLLPRRRAVLQRTADRVSVSLHGPVPTRGPMRDKLREGLPTESPYVDISFAPTIGGAIEMGENRVELVLQSRDPAIDSDLAWRDVKVLASGPAVPGFGLLVTPRTLDVAVNTEALVRAAATGAVDVQLATGRSVRFDRAELIRGVAEIGNAQLATGLVLPGGISGLLDPAFWAQSAAVPDTGGAPSRLMLREFERYYTDRSVPETRAGAVRKRRVVEERLVYAEFFAL